MKIYCEEILFLKGVWRPTNHQDEHFFFLWMKMRSKVKGDLKINLIMKVEKIKKLVNNKIVA